MSEPVRTITFTATVNGVTPTGPQDAGVQGDHNATVVIWQLDSALVNEAYLYRCEYVDGAGGWDSSKYLSLGGGNTLSVPLPRAWTAAGGCAVIRLCISEIVDGVEERTVYTLTGRLQYAGRDSGGDMVEKYENKLPPLIWEISEVITAAEAATEGAKKSAAEANTAASEANAAANEAATAASAANTAAEAANEAAASVEQAVLEVEETLGSELYGEAFHVAYENGGFDASQGEVVTSVRARPKDKAIFMRKGMRVTGGGMYQVDVTEVDSTGAVVKHLCGYSDEYSVNSDCYIRYTVKSIENPTAALTEADLSTITQNVVIVNDNSVDKRIERLAENERFWVESGIWDIQNFQSDFDYDKNENGNYDVPANTILYRNAVTDLLFQKLTWTFKVGTVGAFAFGTRDGSGAANGYYVLVNPGSKTLKIYHSDWNGSLSIKRNLTIDFDILEGETYYAEITKNGTLTTEVVMKCVSATGKSFSYTHNQVNNKLRGWGGAAFASADGEFELLNMTQKANSDPECDVLIIGDSFVEYALSELSSESAYVYKLREKIGAKLIASGRGGATTAALKNKYATDFITAKARYTVLQIGTNDSLSFTVDEFKSNLLELIDRVKENGSIPVLVTIPRRYDTDNTAFITQANAWIKTLGYQYIDEYALLTANRLMSDTIHPNAEGHALILDNLFAVIPLSSVTVSTPTAEAVEEYDGSVTVA